MKNIPLLNSTIYLDLDRNAILEDQALVSRYINNYDYTREILVGGAREKNKAPNLRGRFLPRTPPAKIGII